MTRPVYTDLLVSFEIGASTQPNATQAAAILLRLFKLAYGEIDEVYVAETAHAIIDTENVYSAIVADAQQIVEDWGIAYATDPPGKIPRIELSESTKKVIRNEANNSRHITSTVRLWNSDEDWTDTY